VIERNRHFGMSPMGVAVEMPADFAAVQRDSVWLILFSKLFQLVLEAHPGAQSVVFVFDNKPEIAEHASMIHDTVTRALRDTHAGVFQVWSYGLEVFDEALKAEDQSKTGAHAVMYGPPIHRD
jgi:hypothetical protein